MIRFAVARLFQAPLEGVVGKWSRGTYQTDARSTSWLKVKNPGYEALTLLQRNSARAHWRAPLPCVYVARRLTHGHPPSAHRRTSHASRTRDATRATFDACSQATRVSRSDCRAHGATETSRSLAPGTSPTGGLPRRTPGVARRIERPCACRAQHPARRSELSAGYRPFFGGANR
jgi:hypothetical protein